MSLAEFREWMIWDAHEPLPDRRSDWQHAAASALHLNIHAKRQGGGAWKPDELRLFARVWDEPPSIADRRAAVAQDVLTRMRAWMQRSRDVG